MDQVKAAIDNHLGDFHKAKILENGVQISVIVQLEGSVRTLVEGWSYSTKKAEAVLPIM